MTFNTRTTYTQKPVRLAIQSWGLLTNVQCHRYLYPYHDIENAGTYNWKHTWNHTVSNYPIHKHGHTNCWYVCLLERVYFNSKNAAIMCGMYMINGVHGPVPRSSGGNTSSNPQVSVLIPRPVFNGIQWCVSLVRVVIYSLSKLKTMSESINQSDTKNRNAMSTPVCDVMIILFVQWKYMMRQFIFDWALRHNQNISYPWIILWMCLANERWPYNVTLPLNCWAHSQIDPWLSYSS